MSGFFELSVGLSNKTNLKKEMNDMATIGSVEAEGTDVLVEKRNCKVTEIQVKSNNVNAIKKGGEPISSYLGKVVIPGVLFKLEIPLMFNKKHRFVYAILSGENNGFCNLKLMDPGDEGMNETKAILDLKTAAIQIFCECTGLPAPCRDGGGSCSSCKHRRKAKIQNDDGKMVRHTVCGLDGLVVDKDWHKLQKHVEVTDAGLIGKKEKSTITYQHSDQSPYTNARKGRYKNKTTMKSNMTDEVCNCEYYAAWFHIAKEDKWITGISRQLPWDGNRVIGSEVIVDACEFINMSKDEIGKMLDKIGLSKKVLKKLADSGEDEEVLAETIKLLIGRELDNEEMELLLEEILNLRK